jgi:hypothetical protein
VSRGHFYRRCCPEKVAEQLAALAKALRATGWAEKGGYLIRDQEGKVCARTKWIPRALWWSERPFWFNEAQCAGIVDKRLRGEPLTKLEQRAMDWLLEVSGVTGGEAA